MSDEHETHNLSLTDIPHVIRLAGEGVMLDSRLYYTEGSSQSALLSSMMPHTSRHTVVARYGGQRAVSQFVMNGAGQRAHLVYIAPQVEPQGDNTAWLLVLDATVREAGRRGAHTLSAELDEDSPLFVTMRQSGFAVYARQQVWVYPQALSQLAADDAVRLSVATEADVPHIMLLYSRIVPSLLQRVGQIPEANGFIYREGDDVMAFIQISEGRDGLYLMPYIDHHVQVDGGMLVAAAMQLAHIKRKRLVVRVRRYQGWLSASLEKLGFVCDAKQAVMVRQMAAGIHNPTFAPLSQKLATGQTPRRTESVPEVCINVAQMETISTTNWTSFFNRVDCDGMSHSHLQRCALRPDGGMPHSL